MRMEGREMKCEVEGEIYSEWRGERVQGLIGKCQKG